MMDTGSRRDLPDVSSILAHAVDVPLVRTLLGGHEKDFFGARRGPQEGPPRLSDDAPFAGS